MMISLMRRPLGWRRLNLYHRDVLEYSWAASLSHGECWRSNVRTRSFVGPRPREWHPVHPAPRLPIGKPTTPLGLNSDHNQPPPAWGLPVSLYITEYVVVVPPFVRISLKTTEPSGNRVPGGSLPLCSAATAVAFMRTRSSGPSKAVP